MAADFDFLPLAADHLGDDLELPFVLFAQFHGVGFEVDTPPMAAWRPGRMLRTRGLSPTAARTLSPPRIVLARRARPSWPGGPCWNSAAASCREQAGRRQIVAELLAHRIDHRLEAFLFFDFAHRDQHDEKRQQQRHHVAERDDPFGYATGIVASLFEHGHGSGGLLRSGPQFGRNERVELLFDDARVVARLDPHDPADDDLHRQQFLLVDKA